MRSFYVFIPGQWRQVMEKMELTVQLNVLIGSPKFVILMPDVNEDYHWMCFLYCKNREARTGVTNTEVDRGCR